MMDISRDSSDVRVADDLLASFIEEDGGVWCAVCERREPYQDCVFTVKGWVCASCFGRMRKARNADRVGKDTE